jgi:hypothetical protein
MSTFLTTNGKFIWRLGRQLFVIVIGAASAGKLIWASRASNTAPSQLQILEIILLAVLAILAARADIAEALAERPTLHARQSEHSRINEYMFNLLRNGGRVAIVSNDLTWVKGSDSIKNLLVEKAQESEVTIIVPRANDVAAFLEENGVRVITYPGLSITPKTRFTIALQGRADEFVAIGRQKNGFHTIREYQRDELPCLLAEDLVAILEAYAARN